MGIRAYARHRGCSAPSVLRAIARGRLVHSIVLVQGKPQIADPDLADREWAEATDLSRAPGSVKERVDPPVTPTPVTDAVTEPVTPPQVVTPHAEPPRLSPLAEASATEKLWKARQAELSYRREAGELVEVSVVAALHADAIMVARTKLLGVPSKFKTRVPETTTAAVRILDQLIRAALQELAADDASQESAAS